MPRSSRGRVQAGANWRIKLSLESDKRLTTQNFVEAQRTAGDRWIRFFDGLKMLNSQQTAGLVDGVHPNSLGFYFNAQGLEPFRRKALSQSL